MEGGSFELSRCWMKAENGRDLRVQVPKKKKETDFEQKQVEGEAGLLRFAKKTKLAEDRIRKEGGLEQVQSEM